MSGNSRRSSPIRYANQIRKHAILRAAQRFGLQLTRVDLDAISTFILSGEAEEIDPERGGRSTWHMNVAGVDVVVVFDHTLRSPVTFLTRQMAVDHIRGHVFRAAQSKSKMD